MRRSSRSIAGSRAKSKLKVDPPSTEGNRRMPVYARNSAVSRCVVGACPLSLCFCFFLLLLLLRDIHLIIPACIALPICEWPARSHSLIRWAYPTWDEGRRALDRIAGPDTEPESRCPALVCWTRNQESCAPSTHAKRTNCVGKRLSTRNCK